MVNPTIKILLVEDNPGDVFLLQETLSEITVVQFNVVNVERLAEAQQRLQVDLFDVILLDLLLPDSAGLDTFTALHQQVPLIPIVVLTGMSDETLAMKAMQAGAQDYLVKGQVSGGDLLLRSIRYAIERKRVESTLQKREQELRSLTEHAPDIISRFDTDLKYLFINQAVEEPTGLSVEFFLGKTIRELGFPEAQVEEWENVLRSVFTTRERTSTELEYPSHTGLRYYQSRCVPEFGPDGAVESVLVMTRETTEQHRLEAQLLRAQRMESIGTLASGIAHDLNNILTPILAVAQLLPFKLPDLDEKNKRLLQILQDSSKRGGDLVKQILTFSRGLEGERSVLQVEQIVLEIEQIIRSTFPKFMNIQVLNHSPQGLWSVMADATQLHQVFMNLCVNARDAMPTEGTLTISVENKTLFEADVRNNVEAKLGNYVMLTIEDTGIGIPSHLIDRIFEPFFTTKGVGKGTGLGLSTTIGIIKHHGGFVTVSSELGQGTQFQIFLPAIVESIALPDQSPLYPTGQGELILVADDEAPIRETIRITLESYNYRVITAKDGVDAIATYHRHQPEISVVLMDVMMPSMDGFNAIQALYQLDPNCKIIVFSGTATRSSLPELSNVKGFLSKPYTTQKLLEVLHEVTSQTVT
jgi:two-component system, cell cycle sensor histidine kinase and response regulator CckA